MLSRLQGRRSLQGALAEVRPRVEANLAANFQACAASYPPEQLTLVALKEEQRIEVWAGPPDAPRHVVDYPVLAASGGPGPKLREGDRQVPEGFYRIASLNPNSKFHLSMQVDYPNDFDRARAADEGRTGLGGEIFIHGGAQSIGCLAIGDPAIEELFTMAADTLTRGGEVRVISAPYDFRKRPAEPPVGAPAWLHGLYEKLSIELRAKFA